MNYLVLVRHGQSVWNKENIFTGWRDVGLSEQGFKEAKEVSKELKLIAFNYVYCSPMGRAQVTADIILEHQENPPDVHIVENLKERHYGSLTGMNKEEAKLKYGADKIQIWRRSYKISPPGGESLSEVRGRLRAFFTRTIMRRAKAGSNVLVVAHGNTLRAAMVHIGFKTPETIETFEIPTGKPFYVIYEKRKIIDYRFGLDI